MVGWVWVEPRSFSKTSLVRWGTWPAREYRRQRGVSEACWRHLLLTFFQRSFPIRTPCSETFSSTNCIFHCLLSSEFDTNINGGKFKYEVKGRQISCSLLPKSTPFLLDLARRRRWAMSFYLKRTITSMKDDGSLPCPAYLRGESFKKEVPKTSGEGAH
jgi:hypothetical protein